MPIKTLKRVRDIINKKKDNTSSASVLDEVKKKLLLGDHKLGRAADKAGSTYKKVKDKAEYLFKGGEYGANQEKRQNEYEDRARKLNEEWIRKKDQKPMKQERKEYRRIKERKKERKEYRGTRFV